MRSLLALLVLALTCAPSSSPPRLETASSASAPFPPHGPWATSTTAVTHDPVPERTLAVRMETSTTRTSPWTSRANAAFDIDSDELIELLAPPPESWPDTGPAAPLLDALCLGDVDCDRWDVDPDALWQPVIDAADEAGLLDVPAGTVGDSWERYTSLWITYSQAGGFFMDEAIAEEIDHGVLLALEETPDGPLRGPLVLAALLVADADDDLKTDLMWELVEEHDGTLAILGMGGLSDQGVPATAFDALDFRGEDDLELFRRRFHLEDAHEAGDPEPIRAAAAFLAAHPDADPMDRLDAEELVFVLEADLATEPWEKALAQEVRQCADVAAGDVVHLSVLDGEWTVSGDGAAADCLHGWSWPDTVEDQRVELRVVR